MEADETRRALGPQGERKHPPWSSFNRDLSRLLALSDGIFAFAMTLLVLGLVVPAGFGSKSNVVAYLKGLSPELSAYLLGFLVIYLYWRQHGQVFRYVVSFDWTISNLNILFLLFIAMMPFLTILLAAAGQALFVVWLYAGVQVSAGLTLLALWKYATGSNRHVDSTLPRSWVAFVSRSAHRADAVRGICAARTLEPVRERGRLVRDSPHHLVVPVPCPTRGRIRNQYP